MSHAGSASGSLVLSSNKDSHERDLDADRWAAYDDCMFGYDDESRGSSVDVAKKANEACLRSRRSRLPDSTVFFRHDQKPSMAQDQKRLV